MVNVTVLACVLRMTTNKRRQLFGSKKVHHPRENPGYAYAVHVMHILTIKH